MPRNKSTHTRISTFLSVNCLIFDIQITLSLINELVLHALLLPECSSLFLAYIHLRQHVCFTTGLSVQETELWGLHFTALIANYQVCKTTPISP
jgi:hypothetical protein